MVSGTERPRFPGQNDEHRLGDLLGQMRVARLPQRRRINEREVTRNQRLKGLLGLVDGVFLHQRHVVGHHSPYTCMTNPE